MRGLFPGVLHLLSVLIFTIVLHSVSFFFFQFSSVDQSCPTLCDPMNCSTPGLLVYHQLRSPPKLMSIELVMPSNHLILCRSLLPPSIFPSIRALSNESALRIRWPKYWSFSFSISPSNEYSVLITLRKNWLDLLAVQGTVILFFNWRNRCQEVKYLLQAGFSLVAV